ncbi:hypothetical protein PP485_gp75 [Gordonia phage ThankyouJordi]|uniref:Uncharacterized protein n=1 Tax=Gordonia phage ThankyouJordi TaxID=2571252 RepID=A0A4Y6EGI0_9CAUD|nr:hypothetical protein PP485_gp75 [Gordonia phage ThankyouJordi]QCW22260.1 hypothetical protein SEA_WELCOMEAYANNA_75 [Gordonia phage WelcomeAyanna]QDF17836.1 hypothetical protein SEA_THANKYOUJORDI_75 [Gordonia phage ThankyouJordi]
MTRQKPIELDTSAYNVTTFGIWRELTIRNALGIQAAEVENPVSNRDYLIDKGYEVADIDRVAIAYDHDRYASRYIEHFVPDEERLPELSVRDHLIDVCGYPADAVDAFIEKRAADDRARARKRAEREAYERTWRYRAGKARDETRSRIAAAWDALRGHPACDCEEE